MAQFMLLLYDTPAGWRKLSPADMQKAIEKYVAWGQKARQAGIWVGSHKLTDDPGRVLRGNRKNGVRVTDGPFSESKEVLGGYFMIEAESYDEAVERSQDHPHLEYGGAIELRQVDPMVPPK